MVRKSGGDDQPVIFLHQTPIFQNPEQRLHILKKILIFIHEQ